MQICQCADVLIKNPHLHIGTFANLHINYALRFCRRPLQILWS